MFFAAKILIRLLTAAILLLDASLLLALAAPRPDNPVFKVLRIARLSSTRHAACTLADVLRSEQAGMAPVPAELQSAIHVISQDGDLDLVATPLGNFMIHRKDTHSLAAMVADQSRGVYEV